MNGGRSNPVTASALIRPATMLIAITTRWARVAATRSRGRASGAVSSSTTNSNLSFAPTHGCSTGRRTATSTDGDHARTVGISPRRGVVQVA